MHTCARVGTGFVSLLALCVRSLFNVVGLMMEGPELASHTWVISVWQVHKEVSSGAETPQSLFHEEEVDKNSFAPKLVDFVCHPSCTFH